MARRFQVAAVVGVPEIPLRLQGPLVVEEWVDVIEVVGPFDCVDDALRAAEFLAYRRRAEARLAWVEAAIAAGVPALRAQRAIGHRGQPQYLDRGRFGFQLTRSVVPK